MANDLTQKQIIVKDYITNVLRSAFPSLDLNETGAFSELFINPHLSLLEPILNYIDRVTLMQSIDNASILTVDEMDKVATRYFMTRNPGTRARGIVTFVLENIFISSANNSNSFVIAPGIVALSGDGLRFLSLDSLTITKNNVFQYFNTSTGRIEIPINFEASSTGASYNVPAGSITTLQQPVFGLVGVVNTNNFTGGTDLETNIDFAARIKSTFRSPTMGTKQGYESVVLSNFPASQMYVAGYGDTLMQRDKIKILSQNGVVEEHWGSKVDIYIRDEVPTTLIETIQAVKLGSSTDVSYIDLELGFPVINVVQITKLNSQNENVVIPNFTLLPETNADKIGTIEEKRRIIFSQIDVPDNTVLTVTVRVNQIIQDIQNYFSVDENRPPTADILVRSAHKRYVYGSLILKSRYSATLSQGDVAYAKDIMKRRIDETEMNGEIQFSDIYASILSSDEFSVDSPIDLIQYPTHIIIFPRNNYFAYDCLSLEQQTFLNQHIPNIVSDFKDSISKHDFLRILHYLSFQNGLTQSVLSPTNLTVQEINTFKKMRKMFSDANVVYDLSVTTTTSNPNEYFELADLQIYDYNPPTTDQWRQTIKTIISLSDSPINLTKYILSVVYVCNRALDVALYNEFLSDIG